MAPLEIGNEKMVEAYYESAFRIFRHTNCRQIAKAYIRVLEPRKQVNRPYNREQGYPEKSMPDWWPTDVIYCELDHLKPSEWIRLLIHTLRNLGQSHKITTSKLEEAGRVIHKKIKPCGKLDILNEILKVRRAEESYERGEADANSVYVANRGADFKLEPQAADDAASTAYDLIHPIAHK